MTKDYNSSWDLHESDKGNLPDDEDAYDRIHAKWRKRSWESWLRDNLKLIESSAEVEALAAGVEDTGGVYRVLLKVISARKVD